MSIRKTWPVFTSVHHFICVLSNWTSVYKYCLVFDRNLFNSSDLTQAFQKLKENILLVRMECPVHRMKAQLFLDIIQVRLTFVSINFSFTVDFPITRLLLLRSQKTAEKPISSDVTYELS